MKLNTGTRSSATTASCASSSPGGGADSSVLRLGEAKLGAEWREHGLHGRRPRSRSASGGGRGAKRLSAERTVGQAADAKIASRSSSGPSGRASASEPSAPAFETAATSSGDVKPRPWEPGRSDSASREARRPWCRGRPSLRRAASNVRRPRRCPGRDRRPAAPRAGRSRGSARAGSPRSRRPVRGR